jgi:hypothetical protein
MSWISKSKNGFRRNWPSNFVWKKADGDRREGQIAVGSRQSIWKSLSLSIFWVLDSMKIEASEWIVSATPQISRWLIIKHRDFSTEPIEYDIFQSEVLEHWTTASGISQNSRTDNVC